jgi:hypothetical protein
MFAMSIASHVKGLLCTSIPKCESLTDVVRRRVQIIMIPSFVEMPLIKAMTRGPASLQNRSILRIWELRAVRMNISKMEEGPHFQDDVLQLQLP